MKKHTPSGHLASYLGCLLQSKVFPMLNFVCLLLFSLIRPLSADELMRSNWSIGLHSSKYNFGVSSLTSNYFHFFVIGWGVKCVILCLLLFNLIRPLSADELIRSNWSIGLHSSKYSFGGLSLISFTFIQVSTLVGF